MRTLLPLLFLASAASAQTHHVYLGCYTSEKGSKGIYRADFDTATGKLGTPELVAEVANPSFLHIAPNGETLYAVGESPGKDGGAVYSFTLDRATGKLSDKVALTSGSEGSCHISTDPKGWFAAVSNYGGGSYSFFSLKKDLSLEKRVAVMEMPKVGDKKALGHCTQFDSTGMTAFSCNAGQDRVHLSKLGGGKVVPNDPPFIEFPAGTAPRHIALTPTDDVAFVNGEANMTVNLLTIDLKASKVEVAQTLSTLREGEKVAKGWSTAECKLHPSGKFVYVSNRGHDTIAAFKYDAAEKKLSPAGHITGAIKTPRNFNISPDGKWMLVANQDGGKVGVYAIHEKTGLAKETEMSAKIDKCVCVKFVERK